MAVRPGRLTVWPDPATDRVSGCSCSDCAGPAMLLEGMCRWCVQAGLVTGRAPGRGGDAGRMNE